MTASYTDLTHPLATGMPVYPGDPEVSIDEVATVASDGCSVRSLHLGTHSGTHVDAPAHTVSGGRTIDRVAPGELTGAAAVIQLRNLAPGQEIDAEMLTAEWGHRLVDLPAIVLIATGWDRYWGTDEYLRHPVLTADAARDLVAGGMHVLGTDAASPDGGAPDQEGTAQDILPVHGVLLGGDHLIIENLRGLTGLPEQVEFTALPLHIAGGDGAPVRAVATGPARPAEPERSTDGLAHW
ncbi:cyclase family protein [Corynebacterium terpenotabidum]|uniref:Cyclase family protein n=1 Tax=Corynebacterium terpenotabidum Y-11 TaxID=1200352 RepID=S4XGT4_9CORY|nr:cyclase family protein [Corynebacterium terpenotabidum]AGP31794.1 hypothetical protein A606_10775 [Corynebacterium terpenotabidum Y-11]